VKPSKKVFFSLLMLLLCWLSRILQGKGALNRIQALDKIEAQDYQVGSDSSQKRINSPSPFIQARHPPKQERLGNYPQNTTNLFQGELVFEPGDQTWRV